ncbi:hypothetical protein EJ08DRAFT_224533 [Tothia fuscella]|uniref:Protein kinase domain-containing protein n=1 Tax=Tothia fuscella TaxID=1048955 RepID=A0A9P4P361_9PEZI|nr:hypothetical protein EJ08DRAFT_224533 [Tothia fuscella]
MEWSHYSPHREAGGLLHLPSPTHAHSYHVEAIQKLRRSLSRSPSKSSRFHLLTSKSPNTTPTSPSSPLARAAVSPAFGRDYHNPAPPSPLASHTSTNTKGKKFALRRVAPFRSSPRINTGPRSPVRRALSDNSNQGNITPSASRRSSGDENTAPNTKESDEASTPALRLDLNDGPIKFEFSRPRHLEENIHHSDRNFPAKSSPLKRIDGRINLDNNNFGSPAKRRSLHGASSFGPDFDIFAQDFTCSGRTEMTGSTNMERDIASSFAPAKTQRTSSLRKSTLQNRGGPRTRLSSEHQMDSTTQTTPAQKARNRMSLDPSLLSSSNSQSPFVRTNLQPSAPPLFGQRQNLLRQPSHPHPLSNALTASSSGSILTEDKCARSPAPPAVKAPRFVHAGFTKSLPLGTSRPTSLFGSQESSQASFNTPNSFKFALPEEIAFRSTGLISKKNRNAEAALDRTFYAMPGTPSKRFSYPPDAGSPIHGNSNKKPSRPSLEFGTTNTPTASPAMFGKSNIFKIPSFGQNSTGRRRSFLSIDGEDISQSPTGGQPDSQSSADELPPTPTKPAGTSGKQSSLRSSLFGRRTSLGPDTFLPPAPVEPANKQDVRISEFFSSTNNENENEEEEEEDESHASPIPPKHRIQDPTNASPIPPKRRLQLKAAAPAFTPPLVRTSSTLYLHPPPRVPIAPKFHPVTPARVRQLRSRHNLESGVNRSTRTSAAPIDVPESSGRSSPRTPMESFTPPDPSGLSISAGRRDYGFAAFNSSTNSNPAFPPATPTALRESYQFPFGSSINVPVTAVTENDVDLALRSRFGVVTPLGTGEFSQVYRVSDPVARDSDSSPMPLQSRVFAVKKSKKPFIGQKDKERKRREVEVLKQLAGHEHIVNYVDNWEAQGHLYIQTEFCENGNLFDFLMRVGDKARLDSFRIWKILLELTLGVKYIHDSGFIHLDLKPSNIFITFEGVLKIGDFGLASTWPAPRHIDGEGDRYYIAPEILEGSFDKPADIFALGLIIAEIAANVELPEMGTSWQKLRHGIMDEFPSLTWSTDSSLPRNESGDPISPDKPCNTNSFFIDSDDEDEPFVRSAPVGPLCRAGELLIPPAFMIDQENEQSLDKVVFQMIAEHAEDRPTIDDIYHFQGVQWVEARRRSGATVYEGTWGPADEVLSHGQCHDKEDVLMTDV